MKNGPGKWSEEIYKQTGEDISFFSGEKQDSKPSTQSQQKKTIGANMQHEHAMTQIFFSDPPSNKMPRMLPTK